MWVIEGHFDGLDPNAPETKRKVLYPGRQYPLGRGSPVLHLSQNVVSTEHAVITIGAHSPADATNADAIPKLEYTQKSKKSAMVDRTSGTVHIATGQTMELKDGDQVFISSGKINVIFRWVPINVLIRSGLSRDERTAIVDSLSRLGIKTFRLWALHITHVVFNSVSFPYDFKVLTSLIHAAHFVSPAWLHHVVERGDAKLPADTQDKESDNYSFTFTGLQEGDFRPENAGLQAWTPNPTRRELFKGLRFLVLTVPDPSSDLLRVVAAGETTTHQVAPDDNTTLEEWTDKVEKLRKKADKRGKRPDMGCSLVLLGDADALSQELGDRWNDIYLAGLNKLGLRLDWLSELSDALLKVDVSCVDCTKGRGATDSASKVTTDTSMDIDESVPRRRTTRASSRQPSLPPVIPSTHPSEPSIPGPSTIDALPSAPSKTLLRRNVSRRATATPAPDVEEIPPPAKEESAQSADSLKPSPEQDEPLQRNTLLKRRATAKRDPSSEPMDTSETTSAPFDSLLTIPPSASKGLKRRVTGRTASATPASNSMQESSIPEIQEIEPPHKKFKSLFDGSAPSGSGLESVAEGEESGPMSQSGSRQTRGATLKRKTPSLMDIDEESEAPPSKRRATENIAPSQEESLPLSASRDGAVSRKATESQLTSLPLSETQTQATVLKFKVAKVKAATTSEPVKKATGGGNVAGDRKEPDKEPQFLQALASRTKTKAKEDEFDREFNQLRIAVPDKMKVEQTEAELAVWNEMEHDPNVRGNFMVVEYKDLLRKDKVPGESNATRPDWNGAPNFKKFKKKINRGFGARIDVELPPAVDFGMGDAYWEKDNASTSAVGPVGLPSQSQNKPVVAKPPPPKKRIELHVDSQSSEEEPPPLPTRRKGKAPAKKAPAINLRYSDVEEDEILAPESEEKDEYIDINVSVADEEDDEPGPIGSHTLKSTNSKNRSQRSAPPSTGPASQKSRNTAAGKRKAAPSIYEDEDEEDEDDDDLAFKGFRSKKVKR